MSTDTPKIQYPKEVEERNTPKKLVNQKKYKDIYRMSCLTGYRKWQRIWLMKVLQQSLGETQSKEVATLPSHFDDSIVPLASLPWHAPTRLRLSSPNAATQPRDCAVCPHPSHVAMAAVVQADETGGHVVTPRTADEDPWEIAATNHLVHDSIHGASKDWTRTHRKPHHRESKLEFEQEMAWARMAQVQRTLARGLMRVHQLQVEAMWAELPWSASCWWRGIKGITGGAKDGGRFECRALGNMLGGCWPAVCRNRRGREETNGARGGGRRTAPKCVAREPPETWQCRAGRTVGVRLRLVSNHGIDG